MGDETYTRLKLSLEFARDVAARRGRTPSRCTFFAPPRGAGVLLNSPSKFWRHSRLSLTEVSRTGRHRVGAELARGQNVGGLLPRRGRGGARAPGLEDGRPRRGPGAAERQSRRAAREPNLRTKPWRCASWSGRVPEHVVNMWRISSSDGRVQVAGFPRDKLDDADGAVFCLCPRAPERDACEALVNACEDSLRPIALLNPRADRADISGSRRPSRADASRVRDVLSRWTSAPLASRRLVAVDERPASRRQKNDRRRSCSISARRRPFGLVLAALDGGRRPHSNAGDAAGDAAGDTAGDAKVPSERRYLVDMGTTGFGMAGRMFKERLVAGRKPTCIVPSRYNIFVRSVGRACP